MSDTMQEAPPETQPEPTTEPQEPDTPFEEPEPTTEPEAPEEPVQEPAQVVPEGMSIEELEKVRKKLDQSATTWRNRVEDLLGDEFFFLVPCELCDPLIPGFHWPPDQEKPRDDLHAHLLDMLRTPSAPEYKQAQHVRRCQLCDGWGRVLSGSRVAGKGEVACQMCKGQGFVGDASLPGQTTAPPTNGEVEFPEDTGPLVHDDVDVWGSPRILDDGQENPNYGKMPQYKNPSLP